MRDVQLADMPQSSCRGSRLLDGHAAEGFAQALRASKRRSLDWSVRLPLTRPESYKANQELTIGARVLKFAMDLPAP